ncbi:RecX family transcriptional regulator [Facilibium subflavum]
MYVSTPKEKQKRLQYLIRRGFSVSQALSVIEEKGMMD